MDGITFGYNENGPIGLCKADKLVFVTTRGGCYAGSNLELGAKYMEALCEFFGIDKFECVCAEGIDIYGADVEGIMGEAEKQLGNESFARCNVCYLVNMRYVSEIDGENLTVGGDILKISRARKKQFMNALANYLGQNV